jgi:hypothetical protein
MIEKFFYLSQVGPNKGKWVLITEKACINLAEQGYKVKKVVIEKSEVKLPDIDENDPWASIGNI